MVESSDDPSLLHRVCSSAQELLRPEKRRNSTAQNVSSDHQVGTSAISGAVGAIPESFSSSSHHLGIDGSKSPPPTATAPPPQSEHDGAEIATIEPASQPFWLRRFFLTSKAILRSSWVNVLLVFVPIGIAANNAHLSPTAIFVTNAIAIIPLAGLLSHATESVAASMGDTRGALLNVSFGNAVELIIFIIALVKNEIRIVQASLLGSILANLLLILGMSFAVGGLRYREQIYNSTVTQMSACLLSLSVTSLLLPTAFHASFSNTTQADKAVLQVSRGTSVILLLVYVLYLLFQLKSHAYMYESTPQHVIDEESHPGVLHDMLNSSSSSDGTDSSDDNDSNTSSDSHTTAQRIRRALRGRRRRISSASSKEVASSLSTATTSNPLLADTMDSLRRQRRGAIISGDEGDNEEEMPAVLPSVVRDFENEKQVSGAKSPESKMSKPKQRHRKRHRHGIKRFMAEEKIEEEQPAVAAELRVTFVPEEAKEARGTSPKRPFNIRGLAVRPSSFLTSTVFSTANPTGPQQGVPTMPHAVPRAPYGLRRTHSLPDRLSKMNKPSKMHTTPSAPSLLLVNASSLSLATSDGVTPPKRLSRTSAALLLLISTGLVALCAEFLVSSINALVASTGVSQAFVGLVVLPIVSNAAEHVTAVTVASKNKMDLAIGVAVGSSIQIALFVTPVVVLLGWSLGKDMSLYFSLFETVSLFVSAFIVNFLVLDGRSNYLEGTLLMAAYVIIALAAFFYPSVDSQSIVGGGGPALGR